MKVFKFIALLFGITSILSLTNIKADSYLGFAGVTIPAIQKTYISSAVTKTTISDQYVLSHGAIDSLTGNEKAIGGRIAGLAKNYVTLPVGTAVKLLNNGSLGQTPGVYQTEYRANSWSLTTASFSGIWYLDDFLM